MKDYIHQNAFDHFNYLQTKGKSLLRVILIIYVIFVLICLSSIIIYQRILMKEFRALYGLSEDAIFLKLQEKFQ